MLFSFSAGSGEITLDSALLLEFLAEHHKAENKKNYRNGVKCNELYTSEGENRHNQGYKGVINGCGENYSAQVGDLRALVESSYKIRTLEKAVVLGGAADHLTLQLQAIALFLDMYAGSTPILIKFYSVVYQLRIGYNAEKLVARCRAIKSDYLHIRD